MYKQNIMAKLSNRDLFGRMFPYIPQEAVSQDIPQPQPPVQDPMHGNAGAMAKYGQQAPVDEQEMQRQMFAQEQPRDESTVTFNEQSPINQPYGEAPLASPELERPKMVMDKKMQRMVDRNAVSQIPDAEMRDLKLAEFDYDRPENQDKGWKGWLKELAQNFAAGLGNADPNANLWEKLGAGIGGGTVGAIDRTTNEKRMAGMKIPVIRDRINQRQQMERNDAQTANIYADNEQKRRDADELKNYRTGQLDEKGNTRRQQAVLAFHRSKQYNKSNPSNRKAAELAGLDPDSIPEYDLSNPVSKKINGLDYQWDRQKGEWNPSGLPPAEKDKIIPLEITVPGGKPQIFNVPQSQAASVAASLQAAGMQIDAATDRQNANFGHAEKMVKIRAEYEDKGKMLAAKLAEAKAEKDQTRRIALEQEAARLRQEGIRLRSQLDQQQ